MKQDPFDLFLALVYVLGIGAALIAASVAVGAILIVMTHQAMRWIDRSKR